VSPTRRIWRERAVEFGPSRSLRGIVTTPAESTGASDLFMVLLNAGVIHRVGPNRLSVKLAREFAELGLSTLRFDLSGLGDSSPRTDTTSIDDAIALDIAEAFDFLSDEYRAERFVMLGLCTGGRESFRAAHRDSRVAGAVMIDPWTYPTVRFLLKHFGPRLVRSTSWRNALMGRNHYLRDFRARLRSRAQQKPAPTQAPSETAGVALPEFPSRSQLSDALDEVLARGTELLFVHTGGTPDLYNYRDQLRDAFPKQFDHPKFGYEYIPEAGHTFSCEDTRLELRRRLFSWLGRTGFAGKGLVGASDLGRDARGGATTQRASASPLPTPSYEAGAR
jgi:dienelactone hydrolase